MLALGLTLMILAALVVIAGIFGTGDAGAATLLGVHVGATTIFLLGFIAGLAVLFGLWLTGWGGKRQWRATRERRRLEKTVRKYDEQEASRKASAQPDEQPDDEQPGDAQPGGQHRAD